MRRFRRWAATSALPLIAVIPLTAVPLAHVVTPAATALGRRGTATSPRPRRAGPGEAGQEGPAGAAPGGAGQEPGGAGQEPGGAGQEGPAGPAARLQDGRIATAPAVSSPLVSTGCPKAPYGPRYYAPMRGKTVALTFDDGPGKSTRAIIKILLARHVPATFFNLGENMAAHPRLVRREHSRGFMLGNHTWDHADLTKLTASRQAAEMDRMTAEQRHLVHASPCAFRPPYGSYNDTTLRLARHRHMRVWLWSVDTEDWKADGSGSSHWVDRIVRLAEREGGSQRHPVVLMHNQPIGNPATVRALPRIIRFFARHHYRFVDLSGHRD